MSDNKGKSQPNSDNSKGFQEHKPSGRKGDGPSMKERLLAARQAEADGEGAEPAAEAPKAIPAKKPAAKPASKPAARKPVARKPVVRKGKAKASSDEGGEEAAPKPARKAAGTRKPAAVKRSAGAASKRASADSGDDGEESPRRGRRAAPEKKSNAPMIGGLLAVVVIAGGAWKMTSGGDKAAAAGSGDTATTETSADTEAADAEAAEKMAAVDAAVEQAKEDAAAEAAEAAAAEEAAAKAKEFKENLPATEAPRNTKTGRQKVLASIADNLYVVDDPAEPQLLSHDAFPRFERVEGTTDEEWEDIEKMVGRMFDPMAGARGNRAKIKLEGVYGKQAFPAIVNGMLGLDYTDEDDNRSGDVGQKCLQEIANGRNAGWRYERDTEPNKVAIMNRRTVEQLYKVWAKVIETPAYWDKYAKLEAEAKKDEAADEFGDDLDGDDLDGDDLDDL